jgi:hypothetical protein
MLLSWLDDEHTNISVVLEDGERLASIAGPANVTVPVAPGNADYEYLVANYSVDNIGPPGQPQEVTDGQRTKASTARRQPPLGRRR